MPVFNERATVGEAVDELLGADGVELVLVDDGSADCTCELLRAGNWHESVHVHLGDRNGGKGAAVRTGLGLASGRCATVLDAVLGYRAEAIRDLLAPVAAGERPAAFGIRGFRAHSGYSFCCVAWQLGRGGSSTSPLFNCWITDLMTCQKLIATDLYRQLAVREDGFGVEPAVAAGLLLRGARIHEVLAPYRARRREVGKKLTAVGGLRVLRTLPRCRLRGG